MTRLPFIDGASHVELIGENHATKPDTLNAALKDLIARSGADSNDPNFAGFLLAAVNHVLTQQAGGAALTLNTIDDAHAALAIRVPPSDKPGNLVELYDVTDTIGAQTWFDNGGGLRTRRYIVVSSMGGSGVSREISILPFMVSIVGDINGSTLEVSCAYSSATHAALTQRWCDEHLTEVAHVRSTGDVVVLNGAASFVAPSPGGKLWRIQVDDAGALSTSRFNLADPSWTALLATLGVTEDDIALVLDPRHFLSAEGTAFRRSIDARGPGWGPPMFPSGTMQADATGWRAGVLGDYTFTAIAPSELPLPMGSAAGAVRCLVVCGLNPASLSFEVRSKSLLAMGEPDAYFGRAGAGSGPWPAAGATGAAYSLGAGAQAVECDDDPATDLRVVYAGTDDANTKTRYQVWGRSLHEFFGGAGSSAITGGSLRLALSETGATSTLARFQWAAVLRFWPTPVQMDAINAYLASAFGAAEMPGGVVDELAFLRANVPGGDATILGAYSFAYAGSTPSNAGIGDMRGAGFGTSLGGACTYDAVAGTGTFNGSESIETGSPIFSASGPKTLVIVAKALATTAGVATLRQNGTASFGVGNLGTGEMFAFAEQSGSTLDMGVATAGVRRLWIASISGANLLAEAPTHAQVSVACSPAPPVMDSTNIILGQLDGSGTGNYEVRALLVLDGTYDGTTRDALEAWATTYHDAVLA